MIRLWLSKNSAASLREQLATQLMLGVVSEEFKTGEKLPSVRELARWNKIHPNTVSAAYRELVDRGWLELRKGSGVYVRDLRGPARVEERGSLDELIETFLAATQARGFTRDDVRARLASWLDARPISRLIVAEPEPELCEIVVAELKERLSIPVTGLMLDQRLAANRLAGAVVAALTSRAHYLRAALPAGVPHALLRLRSVPEYLQGQQRPRPDALIGVASSSPEILRRIRTILAAAALAPDALEFRDAREDGWRNGLPACQFVITDVVTAHKVPAKCEKRVFRVLSDASIEELRRFLRLVTVQKVS